MSVTANPSEPTARAKFKFEGDTSVELSFKKVAMFLEDVHSGSGVCRLYSHPVRVTSYLSLEGWMTTGMKGKLEPEGASSPLLTLWYVDCSIRKISVCFYSYIRSILGCLFIDFARFGKEGFCKSWWLMWNENSDLNVSRL